MTGSLGTAEGSVFVDFVFYVVIYSINQALANAKGMHSQGMHSHTPILYRTSYVVLCNIHFVKMPK